MNTRLLRRIQKQILNEPKQFQMEQWFSDMEYWKIPNCGTAPCIGGWAVALSKRINPAGVKVDRFLMHGRARKLLGLTPREGDRLFDPHCWPNKFQDAYFNSNAIKRARIAVARIDWFIKTGGQE